MWERADGSAKVVQPRKPELMARFSTLCLRNAPRVLANVRFMFPLPTRLSAGEPRIASSVHEAN